MAVDQRPLTPAEVATYYAAMGLSLNCVGAEFRCACPIHGGVRESFSINCETGSWYCHSECGRGGSIFDLETNAKLRRFPYSTINALHIRTREDVIRRELLFKVGDRLDPFLIAETERNLRALPFIRAARIATWINSRAWRRSSGTPSNPKMCRSAISSSRWK